VIYARVLFPDAAGVNQKVTQIEVVNKNTEMLIQEKNERVSENSENKKVDDRGRQNNESGVVQIRNVVVKKIVK